jgi:hypothetical protein
MTQPHLIDQLIENLNFTLSTSTKETLTLLSKKLQCDEDLLDHKATWSY